MITKLISQDVTTNWNRIKHALSESIPQHIPRTEQVFSSIMNSIITNKAHIWVEHLPDAKLQVSNIRALAMTNFIYDQVSDTKSLLIYALYGNFMSEEKRSWVEGYNSLRIFAKANDCISIVAYTNLRQVVKLVNSLGGDTTTTFIQLPLE